MKKAKKIVSVLMAVLTALIFVFGLTVFISVLRVRNGAVPNFLGYSVLQMQSGSMEPEYMTGSVIVVHEVDTSTLKVGDVISFYSSNSEIDGLVNTHRIFNIVKVQNNEIEYVTKGDANPAPDEELVSQARIIGKVVYDLGTISGSVISVLKNPKIIFFLIVLPLIFITFGEAFNLVSMIAANKYGKQEDENDEEPQDKKN